MAEPFQKKPQGWHIAGRAWAGARGALLSMLPFYAVMIALLMALAYSLHLLEGNLRVIRPRNDTLMVEMVMRESWYYALNWLARVLLLAPVAVATFRYVLVDDAPRLAPLAMLRVWAWTAVLAILSLGSLYLTGLMVAPSFGLMVIVLKVFAFGLPLLLAPAFAAIAAGPASGSRVEMALEDWDGNIWRFAVAIALTLGPVYLLSYLIDAWIGRTDPNALSAFRETLPGLAVNAAFSVFYVLMLAATLAWCHAWARQGTTPAKAAAQVSSAARREPVARQG
jgi:hypothetical protein